MTVGGRMKRLSKLPAALSFCCKLLYSLPLGSSSRIFMGRPAGGLFQSSVRMTVLVRTVSPGRYRLRSPYRNAW